MPRFHVSRSIEIDASPERVFETVADFRTWPTWSPWLIVEPETQVTVSDVPDAVGSTYRWNGQVTGAGELEHLSLEPGKAIRAEMRVERPFKGVSKVGFDFQPAGSGTRITWTLDSSLPFFLFFLTGLMRSLLGMDYDRGLRMLKEWMETGAITSKVDVRGVQSVGPVRIVGVRKRCHFDQIGQAMGDAMSEARLEMSKAGLPTDGEGGSVYHNFDIKKQIIEFSAGYAVAATEPAAPSSLTDWSLPTTQAFCVAHTGCYHHLGNAWSAAQQHMRSQKLKEAKTGAFEVYRNTPDDTAVADLRTEIYLPLKSS